jgi:hypothetical protein
MSTQSILGFALSTMLAAGCGDTADMGEATPSKAAIDLFWSAYHGNAYAEIPDVQTSLRSAIDGEPENPELYTLLAATHFWHVGESTRDPHPDPAVLQDDMPTAVKLFQKAADLGPDDDHLPGFVGVTTVHAGQLAQDPTLIATGDEILEEAVYRFPEFNNFNRWAAHNGDPRDSPGYHRALDSLWQLLDACAGTSVDRTNPDAGPFVHLQTTIGRKKVCWWGNPLAPYAWEGIMLNLGNGLVKSGQIEPARMAYANAKLDPAYETWPYRAELEAIAASDLAARAVLYGDADPRNDPPVNIAGRGCVYCHAKVGEP